MHVRRGTAKAKALRKPRTMTDVYCILDSVFLTGLVNETVFLLFLLFVAVMVGLVSACCEGRESKDSAGRES